jgi:hypothetical protein
LTLIIITIISGDVPVGHSEKHVTRPFPVGADGGGKPSIWANQTEILQKKNLKRRNKLHQILLLKQKKINKNILLA